MAHGVVVVVAAAAAAVWLLWLLRNEFSFFNSDFA